MSLWGKYWHTSKTNSRPKQTNSKHVTFSLWACFPALWFSSHSFFLLFTIEVKQTMLRGFNTLNKEKTFQKSFAMSSHWDQEEAVSLHGSVRQNLICLSPNLPNSLHTIIKASRQYRLTGSRDQWRVWIFNTNTASYLRLPGIFLSTCY